MMFMDCAYKVADGYAYYMKEENESFCKACYLDKDGNIYKVKNYKTKPLNGGDTFVDTNIVLADIISERPETVVIIRNHTYPDLSSTKIDRQTYRIINKAIEELGLVTRLEVMLIGQGREQYGLCGNQEEMEYALRDENTQPIFAIR